MFPQWLVSVTLPHEAVHRCSKDMQIATIAQEGIANQKLANQKLTLEIGLLAKGTVFNASNIQRQTAEDLAERRKQVAAFVKPHTEKEKEKKKKRRVRRQRQQSKLRLWLPSLPVPLPSSSGGNRPKPTHQVVGNHRCGPYCYIFLQ